MVRSRLVRGAAVGAMLTATAVAVALGADGSAARAQGGMRVAVFVIDPCTGLPTGDGRPACRIRYHPLRAQVRITSPTGEVRTVRSGRDGRLAVELPSGDYKVKPLRGRIGDPPPTRTVHVAEGDYADVIIDYRTNAR